MMLPENRFTLFGIMLQGPKKYPRQKAGVR
jgi:hypothetical protein